MKPQKVKQKVTKDISTEESEKIVGLLTEEELENIRLGRYSQEELGRMRNDKRRELARAERNQREAEKDLRLLQTTDGILRNGPDIHEMSLPELIDLRSRLIKIHEMSGVEEVASEGTTELIEHLSSIIGVHQASRQIANRTIREAKLFVRRVKNNLHDEPEEHLCISCKKRPRHFGDFCKRCVPENMRPKGKV